MNIFPDNYKNDYKMARTGDEVTDLYLRLLMVTDYISGMTDSYAKTLYRELSGIE
jgi:dGTPase